MRDGYISLYPSSLFIPNSEINMQTQTINPTVADESQVAYTWAGGQDRIREPQTLLTIADI